MRNPRFKALLLPGLLLSLLSACGDDGAGLDTNPSADAGMADTMPPAEPTLGIQCPSDNLIAHVDGDAAVAIPVRFANLSRPPSAAISGADESFAVTDDCADATDSCTATITFSPVRVGTSTATVSITADELISECALTGTASSDLVVSVTGDEGRVVSTPAGIDCGEQCRASFVTAEVTLTATVDPDQGKFLNWSGACESTEPTCTVSLEGDAEVTARFCQRGWKSEIIAEQTDVVLMTRIAAGPSGALHITYVDGGQVHYRRRQADGSFSDQVIASTDHRTHSLEIDSQGTAHVSFRSPSQGLMHAKHNQAEGSWMVEAVYADAPRSGFQSAIAIDGDDTIHIAHVAYPDPMGLSLADTLHYVSRTRDGLWIPREEPLDHSNNERFVDPLDITISAAGRIGLSVPMTGLGIGTSSAVNLFVRDNQSDWSRRTFVGPESTWGGAVATTSDGNLHVFSPSFFPELAHSVSADGKNFDRDDNFDIRASWPSAATDANQGIHLVGIAHVGGTGNLLHAHRPNPTADWIVRVRQVSDEQFRHPDLAIDSDGTPHVVFYEGGNSGGRVVYAWPDCIAAD